jgi:hypothetical protein
MQFLVANLDLLPYKNPPLRAGGVAQVVECLPSKHEAEFQPQCHQKKKKKPHNKNLNCHKLIYINYSGLIFMEMATWLSMKT